MSEMLSLEYANRIKEDVCGNTLGCLCHSFAVAPVVNFVMRLGCQEKGLKNSSRPADFMENFNEESGILQAWKLSL